jgi:hypothetical protein
MLDPAYRSIGYGGIGELFGSFGRDPDVDGEALKLFSTSLAGFEKVGGRDVLFPPEMTALIEADDRCPPDGVLEDDEELLE